MQVIPIKTKKFLPPKDDLYEELKRLPKLKEGDVLIITSKVLAIHQGRCVKIKTGSRKEKTELAKKQTKYFLKRPYKKGKYSFLTIINKALISSAGIDKSNGNGYYILLPNKLKKQTREIWEFLKKRDHIKKLGVIVSDSQCVPMRLGTIGVSIGFFGFEPVIDVRKKPDIFGQPLQITRINLTDALAVIGNSIMGESSEQTPLVIIRGYKNIKYTTKDASQKLLINPKDDMYAPLLKIFKKK